MNLKNFIKKIPFLKELEKRLNIIYLRKDWVKKQLESLSKNSILLDAGCGSQQYRGYCNHLIYKGQDFGKYDFDEKKSIHSGEVSVGINEAYEYGKLDYIGDIWNIDESDNSFDAILCTEVFEHIPHPIGTIKEFSRLLKPGGRLILTVPSNCLRHFDPFFFYTGFTDRWFEKFLEENDLKIEEITPIGDYYSWMSVELARTALMHSFIAKILLLPAFLYFFSKRKTKESVNTLCMGYHVLATKN